MQYSIRMSSSEEIWLVVGAILFVSLGIWLAFTLFGKRSGATRLQLKEQSIEEIGLSKRETEVLVLVVQGLSNQEIADQIFISVPTVKTHLSNIYSKLDVKRRTQAVQRAIELGMVAPTKV